MRNVLQLAAVSPKFYPVLKAGQSNIYPVFRTGQDALHFTPWQICSNEYHLDLLKELEQCRVNKHTQC